MASFLETLKSRNVVLYYFGWLYLACTGICVILAMTVPTEVLGINAFIKPAKFFISTTLFAWTMGWYMGLLTQRRKVTIYSWALVTVMVIELAIITGQAALGKMSHFNITTPVNVILFNVMGVSITILTIWTAYIGYLFFRHRPAAIEPAYLWGIRLGILLFVVFAFEGFAMAARLSHTVGAPDGGPGLPAVNWSTRYGDLRTAHFFGMHALQLLPLFGYYIARRPHQVILMAALYAGFVTLLLIQAFSGKPLIAGAGF